MKHRSSNEKQWIVITGAAGFIGSAVVRDLNDQGLFHLILVDDFKKSEKWKNLARKKFIDIISKFEIFDWLVGKEKEIAAIIHLGACSDTMEMDNDYLLKNNYKFTIQMAEYALKNNLRFIYASSAGTYGDGSFGFSDDHSLIDSLHPLSMYAFSKQLFDLWAKRENVLDRIVGLKYFNVFGPNEYHKGHMASMVYKMMKKVQLDGKLQLYKSTDPKYKDGEQCRDFIYVKDAARMTTLFLQNKVGGIFNIGRGEPVTWNALSLALFHALKKKAVIEYVDMPRELVSQYQNYTAAEMKKFFSLFTDFSCTSIEDAVHDYVKNYLLRGERW
ncbi:MAG: ADP-glyceromanno-heptose 6-epimerase [Chlamydiota bacterium]